MLLRIAKYRIAIAVFQKPKDRSRRPQRKSPNPISMANNGHNPIVLYDGVCGLCNRLNQFLLKRDRFDWLRFASLQSSLAAVVLKRHGFDASDLDTVYVILNHDQPDESLLTRSDAIIHLLQQLGGIWRLAAIGKVLPRWLRNHVYNLVATNRYRVFGKYETCLLPEPRHRAKFLDL